MAFALLAGCGKDNDSAAALPQRAIPTVEIKAPYSPKIHPPCPEEAAPPRFRIDVDAASCADYQRCVTAGGCGALEPGRCNESYAVASLKEATAYCVWRGGVLPSDTEWQASAMGDASDQPQDPSPCRSATHTHCTRHGWHGTAFGLPGIGEWTRSQCPSPDTHAPTPVTVELSTSLGESALPFTEYYEFRCVFSSP